VAIAPRAGKETLLFFLRRPHSAFRCPKLGGNLSNPPQQVDQMKNCLFVVSRVRAGKEFADHTINSERRPIYAHSTQGSTLDAAQQIWAWMSGDCHASLLVGAFIWTYTRTGNVRLIRDPPTTFARWYSPLWKSSFRGLRYGDTTQVGAPPMVD